jgi:predicted PurR-regulated permease PerM
VTHEAAITRNGLIFAAALIAAVLLTWTLLSSFTDVVVYAIFAYYVARPVYARIRGWTKSPTAAAIASLIIIILPATVVGLYAIGISYTELVNFLKSTEYPYLDGIVSAVGGYASELSDIRIAEVAAAIQNQNVQRISAMVGSIASAASWVLIRVMLAFIIAQYMLTDGGKFMRWLLSCAPKESAELVKEYVREVDTDLMKVFSGSIVTAAAIAAIAAIVFSLVNMIAAPAFQIPYTILCAVLVGLASLTPLIGASVFYVPLTLVFIVSSVSEGRFGLQYPYIALFLAATFVFVDFGPNLLLKPRLTTRRIPSTLMMLAFILGPAAYGLPGLFIGPIILVAVFHFLRIFLPKLRG